MSEFTESLVEGRIDRLLTQYRESPNLIGMIRTYIEQAAELTEEIETLFDHFDIDTATGDQLTILGKALGWPRCHWHCRLPR